MGLAQAILVLSAAYALIGAVVGLAFVVRGISVVDHAARGEGAPWSFRLLIWPGAAALWPLVLVKWVIAARAARDHQERRA